jgi:hypothetical protein
MRIDLGQVEAVGDQHLTYSDFHSHVGHM